MIEVVIRHKESGAELARIDIENLSGVGTETADYSVRFGVEKGDSVGIHQRGIFNFPRTRYNVLALLLQALNTLRPEDLEWDGEWEQREPPSRLRSLSGRLRHWH